MTQLKDYKTFAKTRDKEGKVQIGNRPKYTGPVHFLRRGFVLCDGSRYDWYPTTRLTSDASLVTCRRCAKILEQEKNER